MRLRVGEGYLRARAKLSTDNASRADRALTRFVENPRHPGLNFEAVTNWPSHYTIRASRAHRVLLLREADENGEVYVAVDVGTHDEIYR